MKRVKLILVAVAAIIATATVSAQDFSIRFSGLMTMGDLAESKTITNFIDGARAGNAAAYGASIGFQFTYDFGAGFGAYASADAMWTPSNKEIRDLYDEHSWTKPQYINIPVIVGVHYQLPGASVAPYAQLGAGVNFFMKTPEGTKNHLVKYNTTESLAIEGGVGVVFGGVFSLGLHYILPGINGVEISTSEGVTVEDYDLKDSMLALRMGFHF